MNVQIWGPYDFDKPLQACFVGQPLTLLRGLALALCSLVRAGVYLSQYEV